MKRGTVLLLAGGATLLLGAALAQDALAAAVPDPAPPAADIDAVADAVCREARGETIQGQMAVAYVVENRRRSRRFPASRAAVLRQKHQFAALADARHDRECVRGGKAWRKARRAAAVALTDGDLNHGAVYFDSCASAPAWMRALDLRASIGAHCFWGPSDAP